MTASQSHTVTQLLRAWRQGDAAALDRLVPMVYQKLRRLARHYMAGQRPGHSLQATALVNEAYMRLVDCEQVNWKDRAHFFAISAQMMRRVLVEFARSRQYQKRGAGARKTSLDEGVIASHNEDRISSHSTMLYRPLQRNIPGRLKSWNCGFSED